MPYHKGARGHGPSIKNPDMYNALMRGGMSKSKAAAISNSRKTRARGKKK